MSAARRQVDLDAMAERCQSLKLVHTVLAPSRGVLKARFDTLTPPPCV